MKFETIDTIPCDICGEDYLPHMLNTNSFANQVSCESCDATIAMDEEMLREGFKEDWN